MTRTISLIAATFLLSVLSVSAAATASLQEENVEHVHHQVYPAAKLEHYTFSNTALLRTLDPNNFTMRYDSKSISKDVQTFLDKAIARYEKFFFMQVPDNDHDVASRQQFSPPNSTRLEPLLELIIQVSSNTTNLTPDMDESYRVEIPQNNDMTARLVSNTVFGMVRGLESLAQLIQYCTCCNTFCIQHTPLVIQDEPYYSHRGLMVDTARHYLPLSLLLDTLDAMAMNKMNVLHWHVTDYQSFPFCSKQFPELSRLGSFGPHRVYTFADIAHVIQEAHYRGIRVIPEFDMPGHAGAIAKSHAEFFAYCDYDPQDVTRNNAPLDPTNPNVYKFVAALYNEIVQLFPDAYLHVGGDEVNTACWKANPKIQAWMKRHNMTNEVQLWEYFELQLFEIVASHDKKIVVWQEVYNQLPNLTKYISVVDVWWGRYDANTIQEATKQGLEVILSGCWYLDHLDQGFVDFSTCIPRNFTGSLAQKSLVKGGHASMWGETVDASNFASRVWPRASATAERLWSGDYLPLKKSILMERIAKFRCQMVARHIHASPVGPGSCPVEPKYHSKNNNKAELGSFKTTTSNQV